MKDPLGREMTDDEIEQWEEDSVHWEVADGGGMGHHPAEIERQETNWMRAKQHMVKQS